MLGNSPFYHRTIRKHVVLFGALFNDIFIVRETSTGINREHIKVPIAYSPKEKFITRLNQDPALTKSIQTTLPRMSFQLLSFEYDATRKQQSTIRHRTSPASSYVNAQFVGIPYNFDFTLSLYVRNIEDGLQVVEQILPFFQPDYTLSAKLSDTLDIVKDIPVVLTSVAEDNQYEGKLEDGTRMILWDLQFTMKSFIFGPISNSAIIMGNSIIPNTHVGGANANVAGANSYANVTGGIYVNIYEDANNKKIQKVKVEGGIINYKEGEFIRSPEQGITGMVYGWNPTSNTLYLSQMSGVLKTNTNIWGLDTSARWNVSGVDIVNQKDVEIRIYQNPINAMADDDYGYTTHIREFPTTLS